MARLKLLALFGLLLLGLGCLARVGASDPGAIHRLLPASSGAQAVRAPTATLRLVILWPQRDHPGFKAATIPETTQAIAIDVNSSDKKLLAHKIVPRAKGATAASASFKIEAQNGVGILARAYAKADPDLAADVPIAKGSTIGINLSPSQVATASVRLTAASVPAILGMSASAGRPGDKFTIDGSGFGTSEMTISASIGGKEAKVLRNNDSGSSITVTVPADGRTGQVIVVSDGVESESDVVYWVGTKLEAAAAKESWDTTPADTILVLYKMTRKFGATPTWVFKPGESESTHGSQPTPKWSLSKSSDPAPGAIASDGTFTAAATKQASLSATVKAAIGTLESSPSFTVRSVIVTGVTLDRTSAALNLPPPSPLPAGAKSAGLASTAGFTATVKWSEAVTIGGVEWSSSAPSTASLAANGLSATVTAAGKGTAEIAAKSKDDPQVLATASVKVTNDGFLDLDID